MSLYKKTISLVTIITGLSLGACTTNAVSPIPYAPVSLEINIMQDAPELNVIGGVAEFTETWKAYQYLGYGGIVIFHNFDDQFVAFDMACPYEVDKDIPVSVGMSGQAVCPQCGSTYEIGYSQGYPIKGPSQLPMRQYNVATSGYDIRVYP